jgi:hypothetical protein
MVKSLHNSARSRVNKSCGLKSREILKQLERQENRRSQNDFVEKDSRVPASEHASRKVAEESLSAKGLVFNTISKLTAVFAGVRKRLSWRFRIRKAHHAVPS